MTQQAPHAAGHVPVRFSSADYGPAPQAFERYCEALVDLCDVAMLGDVDEFLVTTTTWHLAGAVLLENRSSTLRYDRTARHVVRGIDHFQAALYLSGGAEFVLPSDTLLARCGDIALIDMAQPSLTRELPGEDGTARVLSYMLPRLLLAPALPPGSPYAAVSVIPRESSYGRMVGDLMRSLHRCVTELTYAQSQSSVQALAQLLIGSVAGRDVTTAVAENLSKEALRVQIRRHIEQNLGAESLDVPGLCRRFGLSRANLYRLFRPESPATYIQQRRLQRAFAMLISPSFRAWRILDIAVECRFSSDATFIRAFRRAFGLTPGDARDLAAAPVDGRAAGRAPHLKPDAEAVRWVRQLTAASPDWRRR